MRLNEAIEKYKLHISAETRKLTQDYYVREAVLLCVHLNNPVITDIRHEQILRLYELLSTLGYTQNGIYRKFICYRRLFQFFRDKGYKTLNPDLIPIPPKDFTPPRILEEENYRKLLKAIPSRDFTGDRDRALIRMLWDTGGRAGEILSLDLMDLNLEECKATIRTEKTRGRTPFRRIFWTAETNDYLKVWIEARKKYVEARHIDAPNALFISRPSYGHVGQRMRSSTIGDVLRRYSQKAKIPLANAHSFRHAFARDIVEEGGESMDLMNLMGHAQLNSSKPYVTLFGKRLEQRAREYIRRRNA